MTFGVASAAATPIVPKELIGDTPAQVRALWGNGYTICPLSGCPATRPTWLYLQPGHEQHGVVVQFQRGRVARVVVLGQS